MFFEQYPEFIKDDPRFKRKFLGVSEESLEKRCSALLPEWLIKDKTILDLGSCVGSFGQWSLSNGAKHYTGVEIHKEFTEKSINNLSKYNDADKFEIVTDSVEQFLKTNKRKYDVVLAAGILHGFLNVVEILKQISDITEEFLIVESFETDEVLYPAIHFKQYTMINANYDEKLKQHTGMTAVIGFNALSYVMEDLDFSRDGSRIQPENIVSVEDAYNNKNLVAWKFQNKKPMMADRYLVRFKRNKNKLAKTSLNYSIKNNVNFFPRKVQWEFDDSVAARFQNEARTNIPDYDRVINMCLSIAKKKLNESSNIIDVGSALGHTIDVFTKAGFKNICGVDNSSSMIENSLYKEKIIQSEEFPENKYDMVLINWTLHFIEEKRKYLEYVYKNMNDSGILIITDKTTQSGMVEDLYYDFKRSNGVSEEYIQNKKQKLIGYMKTMKADWYPYILNEIGFEDVQIINSRYGFVTFYCTKGI